MHVWIPKNIIVKREIVNYNKISFEKLLILFWFLEDEIFALFIFAHFHLSKHIPLPREPEM